MNRTFTPRNLFAQNFNKAFSLLLFFTVVFSSSLRAQVTSTIFSDTILTYAPITGGSVLSATCTDDDNQYALQPIGFSFPWNGGVHTQIGVNANGWITMGGLATNNFSNYNPLQGIVTSTGQGNIIAGLAADIQGKAAPCGEVRMQTIGVAPNRICVIQWSNIARYQSVVNTTDTFNFQIRLAETGQATIMYGYMAISASASFQVGINGIAATDFATRTGNFDTTCIAGPANSTLMTMSPTNKPVSGLTYSWTFPPMVYGSSTTSKAPGNSVLRGGLNQSVIRLEITATGPAFPLLLTQLNLNTTGTTSAANITNARVFFTGTNPSFSSATQFGATIPSPSGAFSVTGSQPLQEGVNYVWLAYDISPTAPFSNVVDGECLGFTLAGNAYIPTVTAPAGDKTITSSLSGTYTVGASGNYTTLGSAISDLVSLGMASSVQLSLIDPLYSNATGESFPITIPAIPNASPTRTLTIRPAVSNTPIITDSNSTAIFILNGAKYVTIQGVSAIPSAAREMTIQNKSISATSTVIRVINDATSNTISNNIIRGANASVGVSPGSLYVGGTTNPLGAGNDSLVIKHNTFARAAIYVGDSLFGQPVYARAITFEGQNAIQQNDNATIDSNYIYGFNQYGINITTTNSGNGGYFKIRGNSVYDTAQTVQAVSSNMGAIYFAPNNVNSTNNVITGNYVGGRSPFAGGGTPGQPRQLLSFPTTYWNYYGIYASASQSSTTVISNNTVSNLWFNNASTYLYGYGIYLATGSYDLLNNTVGNPSDSANIIVEGLGNCPNFIGVYSFAGGLLNAKFNTISSITVPTFSSTGFVGMYMTSNNSAVCNIDSNTISKIWTNSNSTSTSGSTCGAFTGIYSGNASPNVSIRGNIIGGPNAADSICLYALGGARFYGIYAISGIQNIANNRIQHIYSNTNGTGSMTGAAIGCIYVGSGTNGQFVTNNIIRDIRTYQYAGLSTFGILSGSGAANISGNNISNFNITSNVANTTTAAAINGIMLSSANIHTATNNIISDLTLLGHATNGVGQVNGIYAGVSNQLTLTGNQVSNLTFNGPGAGSIYGIYNNSAGVNQIINQNKVTNLMSNDVSNNSQTIIGIYYQTSAQIIGNSSSVNGNLITGLVHTAPTTGTPAASNHYGIQFVNGTATVANNMIRLGRDTSGVVETKAMNLRGMLIANSSGQLRVYHNNIYAEVSPAYGALNSAAIEISATPAAASFAFTDVRNNILVNNSVNGGTATGNHYNIMYPATLYSAFNGVNTYTITSDFNLHSNTPSANTYVGRFNATNYLDLNALRTAVGTLPNYFLQEGSSGFASPNFVNASGSTSALNLNVASPTPVEGNGDTTVMQYVSTDFNGTNRTGNPDVGATNGAFTLSTDVFGPAIYTTSLLNVSSPVNRTITASVYDNGMVPVGANAPRVYFQKRMAAGGATAWFSAAGVPVSGSTRNRTFTFAIDHATALGGLTVGDTVAYYIIAQDSSAGNLNSKAPYAIATNVNTVGTAPLAPNTYRLTDVLPSTIYVGAGAGSPAFPTLTGAGGAFDAINNTTLTANTTILVQGNVTTEDGANALNAWYESGAGGYTVTIRPASNTQFILSGVTTNAQGLFRLNGTSRVNILGYAAAGTMNDSNLILRSTSGTTIPTLGFVNGGGLDTMVSVIFEGRNTSTSGNTAGIVNINPTTTTVGLSNVVFNNCTFRTEQTAAARHGVGLYAAGTTPRFNSNITVTNSRFVNFSANGVFFTTGNANGLNITNNHFYDYAIIYSGTTTMNPILVNPGSTSDNNNISGNWIGGTAPFAGGTPQTMSGALSFTGINVTTGIATGTVLNRNVIQNINLNSTTNTSQHTGINVAGTGAIYSVTNNRVATINSLSNHRYVGISSTATGNVTVTGDTVQNVFVTNGGSSAALTGIVVTTGSSNVTNISNNLVNNLITTSINTGTTTAGVILGIVLSSSSLSQTIADNRVQSLVSTGNAATTVLGIYVSSGSNVITGNTVYGLSSKTTYTGTTTLMPLAGILCASSLTGPQTVNNNTTDSIWLVPTTTSTAQMAGIAIINTFGAVTAIGNTVANINSGSTATGTGTAAGLFGMMISTPSAVNSIISQNKISVVNHTALTSAFNLYGMLISTSTGLVGNNTTVSRNFVHSLRTNSAGNPVMIGIANLQGFATYANNMVRLGIDSSGATYTVTRTMRGIWHQSSIQAQYYHNTVLLAGTPASGALNTSAFESQIQITAGQTLDVRNNIFANMVSNDVGATGNNYGVRYQDSVRVNSNNNLFYTPGVNGFVGGIIFSGANYATLGNAMPSWKGIVGLDMASASGNPNFDANAMGAATVATLALQNNNPAEKSGDITVTTVDDYSGNIRANNGPSDIGAMAGNFNQTPDIFPPVVKFTLLTNSGSISGVRPLNGVSITDNNGIPTSGPNVPRVYYSKDGITWYSTAAISITGTATNAVANFAIDYNLITPALASSDTIRYYVVAQDNAGNLQSTAPYALGTGVSAITAHPANPNRYNFLPVIPANTVLQVGVGQTYTSLTAAGGLFDFLNNSTLGGNISAEITSDLTNETGAISLVQIAEDGVGAGTFTVTIRPNAGTVTPRLIQGNVNNAGIVGSGGMINLLGANRIKIQGIPTGGNATQRMLRIRNTTTSSSSVITVSSATGVLLNNLIIESGNPNTGGGPVEFKAAVGNINVNTPCSFDTINNCVVTNNTTATLPAGIPGAGIYSFGQPNVYNNNIVISNNEISNFSVAGVGITGNNADGFRVTGNSIYYNLPIYPLTTGTQQAIVFLPGAFSNNNTISGNFIGGTAANCGGTPWTVNQTVGFYGIRTSSGNGGNTLIQNNTIQNINFTNQTAFNQMILIYTVAGNTVISGNQLGHSTITNSIQYGQQTTNYGILYNGTNSITCNNNTIQGIAINAPALSASFYGISIISGTLLGANNNLVGSATVANSITLNATSLLYGMQLSVPASTSPTYTVSGNTIANLAALGAQPSIQAVGMIFANSGTPTVTNNTIRNITSNATNLNVAGTAIGLSIGLGSGTIGVFNNNTINGIRAVNTSNAATVATGVYMSSGQATRFDGNRIYDITNASTSTSTLTPVPVASGIEIAGASINAFLTNNQIVLGNGQANSVQYNGIWVATSNSGITINAFNNSVVVDGTATGGIQNSYAFLRGNNSGTEQGTWVNLANNIFANRRTGGTGSHYAIGNQTTSPTNNTWNTSSSNYNLLSSANVSTLAQWGVNNNTVAAWRTNSLSDNFSYSVQAGTSAGQLNITNLFNNVATGNLSLLTANQEVWYAFGKGNSGAAINNLATDYNGTARSTTAGTATTLGSVHMTSAPTTLPYAATASAAPAASTTTTYSFANRNIASLTWGASVPTAITMYDYTGVNPTSAPAGNVINRFIRSDVSGGTPPYNVGITVNYDAATLGGISNATNFKIVTAATIASPVWTTQTTTTSNVTASTATVSALSLSGSNIMITGTELNAPPTIKSTNFAARAAGQTVTIYGSLFTGATALSFNGTAQPGYTVVNDTTITTTVPVGATSGAISVTNSFGTGFSIFNFTVIQAPTVVLFNPAAGTIGTVITVTGTNFTSATQVQVGTTNTTYTVVNATTITFAIPSGATTNNINVVNPAGSAASATALTVYPAPTVSSYAPSAGPVGTAVTITGNNFNSVTGVNFNGVAASYTVTGTTTITTTVPAGATTGVVTVVNGSGTGTGPSFTVQLLPSITNLSPSAGGPGTLVTITGTNFTGVTAVQLNGSAVASYTVVNSTTITAVVGVANTTGVFTVITSVGSASSAGSFTVYPILTVSTFTVVTGGPYSKVYVTATGNATLGASIQVFDSVIVNSGGTFDFNGNTLAGTGTFTALAGSNIRVSSPAGISLSGIAGNIQMSGARSFSTTANYVYNGIAPQVTGNGLPSTVNKLNISNGTGVTLSSALIITDTLSLSGNLYLGANNLTMTPATGRVFGASPAGYVATNGSGSLRMTVANNATNVTFPIGSTSYTPALVQLTVGSTTDVFGVRVADGVYATGNNTGTQITNNVVNRTWFVTETVAGGSVATLNVAWDDSLEMGAFNRTACAVARHNGTNYGNIGASPYGAAGLSGGQRTRVVANVTAFGYFAVGDNTGPLPVKLISLLAKVASDDVVIAWTTVSEINNKGFEVERSLDGRSFEKVGEFVDGAGNSNVTIDYSLTDGQAFSVTNSAVLYYRLRQVDFDGVESYSHVIKVAKEGDNMNGLSAYPNPFASAYNVSFDAKQGGSVTIEMVDLQGKVVSEQTTLVSRGLNTVTMDNVLHLHAGIYFVKVTIDGESQIVKLVKN
ncbi:MAG: IPT/TIG domain-containing protein [Bacteroidota bacterium]